MGNFISNLLWAVEPQRKHRHRDDQKRAHRHTLSPKAGGNDHQSVGLIAHVNASAKPQHKELTLADIPDCSNHCWIISASHPSEGHDGIRYGRNLLAHTKKAALIYYNELCKEYD